MAAHVTSGGDCAKSPEPSGIVDLLAIVRAVRLIFVDSDHTGLSHALKPVARCADVWNDMG